MVSSLMWNCRNYKIIGLAMTEQNQGSLHDVFQLFDEDHCVKQTSYVPQFLWRDVTSCFDIVGPYFSSEETMNAKFVCACILETVKLFQVSNAHNDYFSLDYVGSWVTDKSVDLCGAAPNLSALKATHGHSGMYGVGIGADAYTVKPWFVNPFKSPHYIYWLICSSHQVDVICI